MTSSANAILDEYRKEIDDLDAQLVTILGKRLNICRKVALLKKQCHIAMMQPSRIDYIKLRCAQLGNDNNLRSEFIIRLYEEIIKEACQVESELMEMQCDITK